MTSSEDLLLFPVHDSVSRSLVAFTAHPPAHPAVSTRFTRNTQMEKFLE